MPPPPRAPLPGIALGPPLTESEHLTGFPAGAPLPPTPGAHSSFAGRDARAAAGRGRRAAPKPSTGVWVGGRGGGRPRAAPRRPLFPPLPLEPVPRTERGADGAARALAGLRVGTASDCEAQNIDPVTANNDSAMKRPAVCLVGGNAALAMGAAGDGCASQVRAVAG